MTLFSISSEAIADYLEMTVRQFKEIKQKDGSTTDVSVYDEKRLKKLFGDVQTDQFRALYNYIEEFGARPQYL